MQDFFSTPESSTSALGYTQPYEYQGLFPQQYSSWGVQLNIHLHLMLKLGMSRVVPLLPPHAFKMCTGTTSFIFYLYPDIPSSNLSRPFNAEMNTLVLEMKEIGMVIFWKSLVVVIMQNPFFWMQ
jgi:hypothetical protein